MLAAAAPLGRGADRDPPTTAGVQRLGPTATPRDLAALREFVVDAAAAAAPTAVTPRATGGVRRRRRTPTTAWPRCTRLAERTPRRRRSTCRSAPRATRRPPRCSTALASSGTERWLPAVDRHAGVPRGRERLVRARRFGVDGRARTRSPRASGTKELVAGLPHWLRLRDPGRDTVLYPAGQLPVLRHGRHARRLPGGAGAGRRPVAPRSRRRSTRPTPRGRCACGSNTPGQPRGRARRPRLPWPSGGGRTACRCSPTSATSSSPGTGRPGRRASGRTILSSGTDGVVAVHSLSKRSNLAGLRVGFYAGDAELVHYLQRGAQARRVHGARARRRPPAVAALGDQAHVDVQRGRYRHRLEPHGGRPRRHRPRRARCRAGGFYLWVPAPDGDAWALRRAAGRPSWASSCSPGEFYGAAHPDHVRVAVVQPDDRIDLVVRRAG